MRRIAVFLSTLPILVSCGSLFPDDTPIAMKKLSGKTQTHCVGRFLIDMPVELVAQGINYATFIYGVDINFKKVEVGVKKDDYERERFVQEALKRKIVLATTFNRALKLPLLLKEEAVNTSLVEGVLLRFLGDENYKDANIKSELHLLVGRRYVTVYGESFDPDEKALISDDNRISHHYINPEPMEARLIRIAQNMKSYTRAQDAGVGFCLGGVVLNEKTMGYDDEDATFYFDLKTGSPDDKVFSLNISMDGHVGRNGRGLFDRLDDPRTKALEKKLTDAEGVRVREIRRSTRKVDGVTFIDILEECAFTRDEARGKSDFSFAGEAFVPEGYWSYQWPRFKMEMSSGESAIQSSQYMGSAFSASDLITLWDGILDSMRLSPANGGTRVDKTTGTVFTPPTCASGQPCPLTGWWKAGSEDRRYWIPEALGQRPAVMVERGAPMPNVGDLRLDSRAAEREKSIVWTWVRAE